MERTYTTPLMDKLGVRPGARVTVLGVDDPEFLRALAARALVSGTPQPDGDTDLVFLAADDPSALAPPPGAPRRDLPRRCDLGRIPQGTNGHAAGRGGDGGRA